MTVTVLPNMRTEHCCPPLPLTSKPFTVVIRTATDDSVCRVYSQCVMGLTSSFIIGHLFDYLWGTQLCLPPDHLPFLHLH